MPLNDAWDWPALVYVGTVLLKRSEREFWRMSPRKLHALSAMHVKMNQSSDQEKPKPKQQFIDQLF